MSLRGSRPVDPHRGQPVVSRGVELRAARAAMLMVHGRGATADSILTLADLLDAPGFAFLAPQAAGNTWYPNRFLEPLASNEPWLSSALTRLEETLGTIAAAGVPADRTILLGFSQGACLALEFVARHARRYAGAAGLSGGLIGPDNTPRDYPGSLDRTPVFLGCSDIDPHIPAPRVAHTAEVLTRLGAAVTAKIYKGMGHTINDDELDAVRQMMHEVA